MIYPVATVFTLWAISGHVGPAETALGLKSGIGWAQRSIAALMVSLLAFVMWRTMRARGRWKQFAGWFVAAAFLVLVLLIVLGSVVLTDAIDCLVRALASDVS